MNLRREATKTIWKTVVFAGAMLGSACGGKSKPATTPAPDNGGQTAAPDDTTATPDPCADQANPCGDQGNPCEDPCADRVRGSSDEGDVGRGFLLS